MPYIESYKIEYVSRPKNGDPFGFINMAFIGGGGDKLKLSPSDFIAACAVLSQKRIFFDPVEDAFSAVDDTEDFEDPKQRRERRA